MLVFATLEKTMKKTTLQGIIYQGVWKRIGKIYNIWVDDGYTTIIVKAGEDLKQRAKKTREQFASQADAR